MVAAALLYAAGGTAADGRARVFASLAVAAPTTFALLLLRVPEPRTSPAAACRGGKPGGSR